ncbi:predicted protein [Pyrenophora tritici-repentis Pt-1C-BFP]|uniref:Uncharacterized protein n=1 Tax=Pyrenophora tritici-repentis (strain Pt-1C-BFP) TaxID=426418 RepID=B2VUY0_PYRTR|nr:uncharacterized protein PTRG_01117 [Pyrenophora tritici-repentis Pt-1C-BFP]EDU40555.1 predicted protein [Pyrenophora tritici-repentis Pt-1C-BFP]
MGLFLFGLAMGIAISLAASSRKVEKQGPEVSMSGKELKELLEDTVCGEIQRQLAVRENYTNERKKKTKEEANML